MHIVLSKHGGRFTRYAVYATMNSPLGYQETVEIWPAEDEGESFTNCAAVCSYLNGGTKPIFI